MYTLRIIIMHLSIAHTHKRIYRVEKSEVYIYRLSNNISRARAIKIGEKTSKHL